MIYIHQNHKSWKIYCQHIVNALNNSIIDTTQYTLHELHFDVKNLQFWKYYIKIPAIFNLLNADATHYIVKR